MAARPIEGDDGGALLLLHFIVVVLDDIIDGILRTASVRKVHVWLPIGSKDIADPFFESQGGGGPRAVSTSIRYFSYSIPFVIAGWSETLWGQGRVR
jgi:hypothetical protein